MSTITNRFTPEFVASAIVDLAAGNTLTLDQELAIALHERDQALRKGTKQKGNGVSMKVSVKGAVSVYGLGRFPVTLYASQWKRLFAEKANLENFIVANDTLLAKKEE